MEQSQRLLTMNVCVFLQEDDSSYLRSMGSLGARARAGLAAAMDAGRLAGGLEDSSMVPVSFKAQVGGFR